MRFAMLVVASAASFGVSAQALDDFRAPDYSHVVVRTLPDGSKHAELAGQITHVVRVNPDGSQSCAVEGSDPKLAVQRAAGLRQNGTKGLLFDDSKAAAQLQLINLDAAGEGLNDATPVAPIGGNPGTTLGQQRQIAISYAAEIWGRVLESTVPIRIGVNFDPLACSVLGGASPTNAFAPSSAPSFRTPANHWYVVALVEALAGSARNLDSEPDILMRFNSARGTSSCPGTSGQYLGLAQLADNRGALVPTSVHEIGHGLGFTTSTCVRASCGGGRILGDYAGGVPDIFDYWTYDWTLAKYWDQMTSAERAFSSRNDPNLVWRGTFTTLSLDAEVPGGQGRTNGSLRLFAPPSLDEGSSVAHFHQVVSPNVLMEPSSNVDVFSEVGITAPFMFDIGWVIQNRQWLIGNVVGSGGIGSSPTGLFCPADCREVFSEGQTVNLVAISLPGWQFAGWSGACMGMSTTCQVTMSQQRNVTATFTQAPPTTFVLNVTAITGSGAVASAPSGIACPGDCTETFNSGQTVSLSATPAQGWEFVSWSGDCSGTLPSCQVSMTQARSVSATFALLPADVVFRHGFEG